MSTLSSNHEANWMYESFVPRLVSVIIPTYNRAHFLKDAMDSVFNQTYRPIELIIIDDGSKDETSELVAKWASEYGEESRFQCKYFHQANGGAPKARNNGLIKSRGEFIQFHDSDDILHPQKLEIQVNVLDTLPDISRTVSSIQSFRSTDKISLSEQDFSLSQVDVLNSDNYNNWTEYPSSSPQGLQRRKVCLENGPWKNLPFGQDTEYFIRLYLANCELAVTEHVLVFYRCHDEGNIHSFPSNLCSLKSRLLYIHEIGKDLQDANSVKDDDFDMFACLCLHEARQAIKIGGFSYSFKMIMQALQFKKSLKTTVKTFVTVFLCFLFSGKILFKSKLM